MNSLVNLGLRRFPRDDGSCFGALLVATIVDRRHADRGLWDGIVIYVFIAVYNDKNLPSALPCRNIVKPEAKDVLPK